MLYGRNRVRPDWIWAGHMYRRIFPVLMLSLGIMMAATVAAAQCPLENGLWGSPWGGAYPGLSPWSGFGFSGTACPYNAYIDYPWYPAFPAPGFPGGTPWTNVDLNRQLFQLRNEIESLTKSQNPDPVAMKTALTKTLVMLDSLSGPVAGPSPAPQTYYRGWEQAWNPYWGGLEPSGWVAGLLPPPGYWFGPPSPSPERPASPATDAASSAGRN